MLRLLTPTLLLCVGTQGFLFGLGGGSSCSCQPSCPPPPVQACVPAPAPACPPPPVCGGGNGYGVSSYSGTGYGASAYSGSFSSYSAPSYSAGGSSYAQAPIPGPSYAPVQAPVQAPVSYPDQIQYQGGATYQQAQRVGYQNIAPSVAPAAQPVQPQYQNAQSLPAPAPAQQTASQSQQAPQQTFSQTNTQTAPAESQTASSQYVPEQQNQNHGQTEFPDDFTGEEQAAVIGEESVAPGEEKSEESLQDQANDAVIETDDGNESGQPDEGSESFDTAAAQTDASDDTVYDEISSQFNKKGKKRTRRDSTDQAVFDPKCNSELLKKIITDNIESNTAVAKKKIQAVAAKEVGGWIDVICSSGTFSYIVNTEVYCETEVNGITCFAFRQSS